MTERPLVVERYTNKSGHYWRVRHTTNSEIMGQGEAYADIRDRDHAIEVLFPGVPVVDVDR